MGSKGAENDGKAGEYKIAGGNRRVIQMVKVRPSGWTKAKRKLFLDNLAVTCNVTMATSAAGMRGKSAYELRRADPVFAGLWKEALTLGYERLEELLLQHALTGVNAIIIGDDAGDGADAGSTNEHEDASEENAPARGHAVPGSGMPPRRMAPGDVQLALALLNRHRATVEGRGAINRGPRRATADETDAALRKKLDMLARQKAAS